MIKFPGNWSSSWNGLPKPRQRWNRNHYWVCLQLAADVIDHRFRSSDHDRRDAPNEAGEGILGQEQRGSGTSRKGSYLYNYAAYCEVYNNYSQVVLLQTLQVQYSSR